MQQAPVQSAGNLQEGQIIGGRFTIGPLLAQDPAGPLFHARRRDGHPVTLQVIAPGRLASVEAVNRADREVRTAQALHHPHICSVSELVQSGNGVLFVVREQLSGEGLDARLQRLGRPPVEAALDILERIASAMASAHRKGLFHLHLGTHRVLLQQSPAGDIVRVVDLGLFRLFGLDNLRATPARPAYVSPEQVVSPRQADARADVYALGVLLYELLTGRTPFLANDPDVLMAQHVNDKPPTLADRAPDRLFSAELEGLVAAMLAKPPQDRPADAQAVLARLQRLRQAGDLVIALDDREAQLLSQWTIAPQAAAAAALGLPAQPTEEGVSELPGLVSPVADSAPSTPRRRTTTARRAVVTDPAIPRRAPPPPDQRRSDPPPPPAYAPPAPAAMAPQLAYAPTGALPLMPTPMAPLVPAPVVEPEPVSLDRVLGGASPPRSAADALEPLLLPSTTAENEIVDAPPTGTGPLPRARAWLRRPVAAFGKQVPRGALVGAGFGGVMTVAVVLFAISGEPEIKPEPPTRLPPRRAPATLAQAPRTPGAAQGRGPAAGAAVAGSRPGTGATATGGGASGTRAAARGPVPGPVTGPIPGPAVGPVAGPGKPAPAAAGAAPPKGPALALAPGKAPAAASAAAGGPALTPQALAAPGARPAAPGTLPRGSIPSPAPAGQAGTTKGTDPRPAMATTGLPPKAASPGAPGPAPARPPAASPVVPRPATTAPPSKGSALAAAPPTKAAPGKAPAPVAPPKASPAVAANPRSVVRAARDPGGDGEPARSRPRRASARPIADPPPPGAVTVRIVSLPAGAQVLRDGQVVGTTPFSEAIRRQNQPLTYQVMRVGYESAKVEVVPSQDRQVQLDLSPVM